MSLTDLGAALLRRLGPEQAHQLAIKGLTLAPLPVPPADDPILRTQLAGLDLPNPVGLAAGLDGVDLGTVMPSSKFAWEKSFAELNEPVLAGVEVVAVCEWDVDDQGRDREKVAFLNSTAGGGVKRAEADDVRSIASQADGFLALARANNPNKPKPQARPSRDQQRDDEMSGEKDYHY